jgi:hypothetical protein
VDNTSNLKFYSQVRYSLAEIISSIGEIKYWM